MTILEVEGLSKSYPVRRGFRSRREIVVDDVSFALKERETLAIVGESGAGKSTIARLVTRLIDPDKGRICFMGTEIQELGVRAMRPLRRSMQIIFQDPFSSLDPKLTIRQSVAEPMVVHGLFQEQGARIRRVREIFDRVGLNQEILERYPQALSGGQLQRVAIARALTVDPVLIVCDEAVGALDVSVRAQVINLLKEIQDALGVAYLFISHDLALVEAIADRVAVMRKGRLLEVGDTEQIFHHPASEYTRELLLAIPRVIPKPL